MPNAGRICRSVELNSIPFFHSKRGLICNDIAYLEGNIVRVKEILRRIERQMQDSPSPASRVEYRSYQRHLKEIQAKLVAAKHDELVAVG
ncbi:MAG: hypothetical protein LBQ50_01860 [Planctomycetaceae bacterium]|jgi:hypothetical protein|nr:hypothetical protein [Planctomycetaceae bacterium]